MGIHFISHIAIQSFRDLDKNLTRPVIRKLHWPFPREPTILHAYCYSESFNKVVHYNFWKGRQRRNA